MFLSAPQHLAVVPGPRRSENNNWKSSGSVINAVLAQINNDYQQMILGEPRHGEITKKIAPIIMILCHLVCQVAVKIFQFTISQRNSDPNYDM